MLRSFLQLIRFPNLLFLALILWVMEKWVAVPVLNKWLFPEQLPWWVLLLLILAVVLIAGGGYVINDYFDIKIDRINRPDRLLVTTVFTKDQAMRLFYAMSISGVLLGGVVALLAHSRIVAIVVLLTTGLLWFYSSSYKRQLLLGNLIVAFVSALVPMLVAMVNINFMEYRYEGLLQYTDLPRDMYIYLGGFALFAFLLTWIREIIKDLQDEVGDRELECHSLPIVIGATWTKVIVTILTVLAMVLVIYLAIWVLPFGGAWNTLTVRYAVFGIAVPLGCSLALLWASKIPSDYRSAQLLIKFIMFLGVLFAFVIRQQL